MELSPVQVSGTFPIDSGVLLTQPVKVAETPRGAKQPASLTVINLDSVAVMSLKWISGKGGFQALSVRDCPIRLTPGMSFTWDSPPSGAQLLCVSTVAGALLGVDGSWAL